MAAEQLLFCTELIGLQVYDTRGRKIGRVKDAALVPIVHPTRIDRFLIGGGWAWLTIRYDQVQDISLRGIYLKDEQLTPYHSDEYMLRIVRDLLDQQIIDSLGRKVVRVNDVTFKIQHDGDYYYLNVLEVDIGVRSILRRLVQGVAPPRLTRRLQERIKPNSIPWEYCNIVEADPLRRLRLNISHQRLERLHPADLADIVEDLSHEDREAIIETIDAEVAADALSEMDPDVKTSILESIETERAAEIIEEMAPEVAAHTLADLEEETSTEIFEEMADEAKSEVSELIEYREHTAGFLMNTEYLSVPQEASVEETIATLRKNEEMLEVLNTVFLVDEQDRLVGAVPIAKLFVAPTAEKLLGLTGQMLLRVKVNEQENRVTELFDKYNLLTLPVTDEEQRLVGVITADDVISVLRQK